MKKVLFVFAHPDDESFSSGGTIAKLTKQGIMVKLVTATRGEAGSTGSPPLCRQEQLGKVREQELRKAAKVLGISQIYFLDFIDGTLHSLPLSQISKKVLEIFKEEQPDTVVTFNKEGGSRHPDHVQMSKATTKAFKDYLTTAKKHVKLYHTAMPKSFLKKFENSGLSYQVFGKIKGTLDKKITTVIDIRDTFDVKLKALKCHQTQKHDWERFLKRSDIVDLREEFFQLISENSLNSS